MTSREFQDQECELSTAAAVETAGQYVRRMVATESSGWGDHANAQQRLERRYGIPYWSLEHIRTGRAKTVDAGLFARIRAAYLDLCERQMARLQHEIQIEKALHEDDTIEDLEREAASILARLAAKKAARAMR